MLKFEDVHTEVFPYFSVDVTRDDGEYLGFISQAVKPCHLWQGYKA